MTQTLLKKLVEAAKPFKPFAYVVVVIGLLMGGFAFRSFAFFSQFFFAPSLTCLLGLWLWLGTCRWPIRVAVLLLGFAGLEKLAIAVMRYYLDPFPFLFLSLVALIAILVMIWIVLYLLQVRLKLAPTAAMGNDRAMPVGSGRFYMLDLLALVIAAAILLRSMQSELGFIQSLLADYSGTPTAYWSEIWSEVGGPSADMVIQILSISLAQAVGALAALWAVFGKARLPQRLLVLFGGTPLVGMVATGFYIGCYYYVVHRAYPFPWLEETFENGIFVGLQSVFVAAALIVFRACGYQVVRLPVPKLES